MLKEEREEEIWKLAPKGCFASALIGHISLDEDTISLIWHDFVDLMQRNGYVDEEE